MKVWHKLGVIFLAIVSVASITFGVSLLVNPLSLDTMDRGLPSATRQIDFGNGPLNKIGRDKFTVDTEMAVRFCPPPLRSQRGG